MTRLTLAIAAVLSSIILAFTWIALERRANPCPPADVRQGPVNSV